MSQNSAVKLDIEAYHKHRAISKSGLDRINRSPAHYLEWMNNPPDPTPAMIFGDAVHTAILQPELLGTKFVVAPALDRRTKAGKEEYEAFLISNHGKKIISRDDFDAMKAMVDAVYSHPTASKLLASGHPELSYFWQDADTGVELRCRPDFLRDQHIIVDVKTTINASLKDFQRSIANFRYDVQAAVYCDGLTAVTGEKYDSFVFIAVEKEPPFAVACYVLDEASIDAGRFKYRNDLNTFARCLKTNEWPSYSTDLMPINLPSWAWPEASNE